MLLRLDEGQAVQRQEVRPRECSDNYHATKHDTGLRIPTK